MAEDSKDIKVERKIESEAKKEETPLDQDELSDEELEKASGGKGTPKPGISIEN